MPVRLLRSQQATPLFVDAAAYASDVLACPRTPPSVEYPATAFFGKNGSNTRPRSAVFSSNEGRRSMMTTRALRLVANFALVVLVGLPLGQARAADDHEPGPPQEAARQRDHRVLVATPIRGD